MVEVGRGHVAICRCGVIHCVMMASQSASEYTTSGLYNDIAFRYCQHVNDQDLAKLELILQEQVLFHSAELDLVTTQVQFKSADFEAFMAVVWMILLYPQVHQYDSEQREAIVRKIYNTYFVETRPLIQQQDHLVIRSKDIEAYTFDSQVD